MTNKFEIITIGQSNKGNEIVSEWGFSKTREKAIQRATKLTKSIRTDVIVAVRHNGEIIAKCGTNSGPGGVSTRELS